jgi:peptidoglycan/xylan/chitin deacetylase (PgdA/CDA1 family)
MMDNDDYTREWKMANRQSNNILEKARNTLREIIISSIARFNFTGLEDKFLRPLFTHNVFDDQVDEFESIIVHLKQIGTFINTETLILMLEGKMPIDGRYFHLSFDDGFKNIYTNAFPILQKHKIPALFFVPSALIGANWPKTYHYCKEITHYGGTIELIDWNELRILAENGIEIGSHTRNHVCISSISQDKELLLKEIKGSKDEIENRLGRECKYISWPYGLRNSVDQASLNTMRAVGYEACFGGYRGSVKPGITNHFSIPRHYFETNWPLSHVMVFVKGRFEERCFD